MKSTPISWFRRYWRAHPPIQAGWQIGWWVMRGHLHNREWIAPQRIRHAAIASLFAIRNQEQSFRLNKYSQSMPRLAFSLATRSSPDNGRVIWKSKFPNGALVAGDRPRLPLWVKNDVLTLGFALPVFPDQRTYSASTATSQRCHKPTSLQSSSDTCQAP